MVQQCGQRETSRVWFPSLPLSSISLSSPTWLVSCMFVMSSTQKGAFSIYINAGVRMLACRRALKRESSRPRNSAARRSKGSFQLSFSSSWGFLSFLPSFLPACARVLLKRTTKACSSAAAAAALPACARVIPTLLTAPLSTAASHRRARGARCLCRNRKCTGWS